jgi:hypothetical protein
MRFLLVLALLSQAAAADLQKDLTFRARFDGSTDAQVALGDRRIYTARSYQEQASAQPGLHTPGVEFVSGKGLNGSGALHFKKKNSQAVFYRAEKNVAFDAGRWTGTVSFWLSLDPDQDLEPGYCDPLQLTDKAYNDSAVWVDFTKDDKPRHFRLGVFGALASWNPQNVPPDQNPAFQKRLVVVKQPPFARGKWTNVAITFSGLGSNGTARLYLDGKPQGSAAAIREPFSWDLSRAAIRLGISYVGLMDDLSVFRRSLSPSEIASIAAGNF